MEYNVVVAALAIPSVTALGCITAYVYSEQKGLKGSVVFLKRFFPKRTEAFYFRLDFFISAIIGTGIGLILYSPTTVYQALAAGIGWTAAFNLVRAERLKYEQHDARANDGASTE